MFRVKTEQLLTSKDILCVADTHYMLDDSKSRSVFGSRIDSFPPEQQHEVYIDLWSKVNNATHQLYHWLEGWRPKLMIHMGDVACLHTDGGRLNPEAYTKALNVVENLRARADKVFFCLGDHDTGEGDSLNLKTLEACQDIFGPLWWQTQHEGVLLIGICSTLATYAGKDQDILSLQRVQASFVGHTLRQNRGRPWILFSHLYQSPLFFSGQIKDHLPNMLGMVCGDLHNHRIFQPLQRLRGYVGSLLARKDPRRTWFRCLSRSYLCPSIAPIWGPGYAMLRLRIGDTGKLTTKIIKLWHQYALPWTANPIRCLYWRMHK